MITTGVIIIMAVAISLISLTIGAVTATKIERRISVKEIEAEKKRAAESERGLKESAQLAEKVYKERLEEARMRLEETKNEQRESAEILRKSYEKSLEEIKVQHEKTVNEQIRSIRAQMIADTETILKNREEELNNKAESTFKTITASLGKDLEEMKRAFSENKESNTSAQATLKTKIDEAVRHLQERTLEIGKKADNLAEALRGQNKVQGCWGETVLANLLRSEGLQEGRDYETESYIRSEEGRMLINENSGHRMRPDFILHFPDDTDIIIDSKITLTAVDDYMKAENDEERQDAAKRNLTAIWEHVKGLSKKKYDEYYKESGKKTLGYTVMFIHNYGAMELARNMDPTIFDRAFKEHKVLITTSETLMPFLRMIRNAWFHYQQDDKFNKVVDAAQRMIKRVGEFTEAHAKMGESLHKALEHYEKCDRKIREGGQSILRAAKDIEEVGIKSARPLPHLSDE